MSEYIIEARNIRKLFGGVVALNGAEFLCPGGQIVGLLGENGSGKTTLSNIIMGNYAATDGELLFKGQKVRFSSPREAEDAGIAMVHQNFSLVPDLTVWENLLLGNEPRGSLGMLDNKQIRVLARQYLDRLCPWLDMNREVRKLLASEQQLVEISKALSRKPEFLILDEPTAALEREEVEILFKLMKDLKAFGISMVFISHRMHEVEEICDYVVVLRNGKTAGTVDLSDPENVDYDEIVRLITGQRAVEAHRRLAIDRKLGEVILRAESIGDGDKVKEVSFQISRGEIVGLAGLQGQGQEELMLTLAGYNHIRHGSLNMYDKALRLKHPKNAIAVGMPLVPGNRQTQGLFMGLSVMHNTTFPKNLTKGQPWILGQKKQAAIASKLARDLTLKTDSLSNPVTALSGGNAQKVVVAKWLPIEPKVLLLSDPAKGIDVQSKADLYKLVGDIAMGGTSIFLYASDLNELLHICDRILIMYEGRIVDELTNSEQLDEETLMIRCMQHQGVSQEYKAAAQGDEKA
ncbi:MAG: sugar ABC transporter ATP-binding protein [Spirochaetaceae bacterium]|nr:MAG: sugar ABC transporter ATP-binding protein [Spirochaetaceae bacterium]